MSARIISAPPRALRLSVRLRLTSWYVLSFAVILLALGAFLVVSLRDALVATAQDSLELTATAIVRQMTQPGDESDLGQLLAVSGIHGDTGQPEIIGQVLDSTGRVTARSGPDAPSSPILGRDELGIARSSGHWHGPVRLATRAHDDIALATPIGNGAGDFLVLAQTLAPAEDATNRLVALLLVAAPAALALAAFGGWLLARAALRPVDAMARTAAEITAEGAPRSLPVPAQDDELGRLARTLNAMLERLGRSIAEERRFTADASHELRTPIALMQAELDVALRSKATPPAAREVLRSVREEARHLERIVENLLLLSRSEAAGRVELVLDTRDLLDTVSTVVSRFKDAAASKGIAVAVTGEPSVARIDRDLFAQAVSNLVDNAIKYTAAGGRVEVSVDGDAAPSVEVRDTGRGIPGDALAHIFERFYRVDGTRRRTTGGAGLGLEITRRIVEAHGGTITAESREGVGTTFTVRLPTP